MAQLPPLHLCCASPEAAWSPQICVCKLGIERRHQEIHRSCESREHTMVARAPIPLAGTRFCCRLSANPPGWRLKRPGYLVDSRHAGKRVCNTTPPELHPTDTVDYNAAWLATAQTTALRARRVAQPKQSGIDLRRPPTPMGRVIAREAPLRDCACDRSVQGRLCSSVGVQ